MNNIVVNGIGILSPFGMGVEPFWKGLINGDTALSTVESFDLLDCPTNRGGLIPKFDTKPFIKRERTRHLDRVSRMNIVSTGLAIADSGLYPEKIGMDRCGLMMGSSFGAIDSTAKFHEAMLTIDKRLLNPMMFPNTVHNSPASQAGIEYKINGLNITITTSIGSVSGINAVGLGMSFLKEGDLDLLFAGGFDELSPKLFYCYSRLNKLANHLASFDRNSSGNVPGEGSAMLSLQREDKVTDHSGVYGRITGYATNANPSSDPNKGLYYSITGALNSSNLSPEDIDLIVAEGRGEQEKDRLEINVLRLLFGTDVPITTITGNVGCCLGAKGVFSIVCGLLSLKNNLVPPIIGLEQPIDPEMNYIRNKTIHKELKRVLVIGFDTHASGAIILEK
jgi:3-oxoacyl-[acyl-carrier-protein] synthase II